MASRFIGWLFGGRKLAEEHWVRFMEPHVQRARAAGISEERIDGMVRAAIDHSDGVALFPGMLLRDMVDREIGNTE